MKREIVTALIAVFIVQSVEGFDPARLQSKDVSSSTSIPNEKPKSAKDVYKEKVCASEPTCDLLTTVPEYLHKIPFRGCMCDLDCVFYGDCCQDSKYYNKTENSQNHLNFYCFNYGASAIYIKNKCLPTFTDSEVVNKCHIADSSFRSTSDDLAAMVTDPVTNITYANKYCAKCNRVDNYVSWNVTYSNCHGQNYFELSEEFHKKFENEFLKKVSHFVKFNQTTSEFYADFEGVRLSCQQRIIPPRSVDPIYLRSCLPLISSCQNTTDKEIMDKCASYMSIVHDDRYFANSYRNKYCAKCNMVSENKISGCPKPYAGDVGYSSLSFGWESSNRAGGSGACGVNANEAVNEKFSCE